MTRHCEHVKSNGHFCGSPAMRRRNYCYFHLNYVGHKLRAEKQAACGQVAFELPLLEDAASVQLALMQVTNAMLQGTLDPKRAGLVLYALQTASINLRNMEKEVKNEETAAVCNRYDSFEADYELEESAGLRVEMAPDEEQEAEIPDDACDTDEIHPLLGGADWVDFAVARGYFAPVPRREIAQQDTLQPSESEAGDGAASDAGNEQGSAEPAEDSSTLGPRAPHVAIPDQLTRVQYHQAKYAVANYERDHKLTASELKAAPQRAAISQKLFVGARKPVQSVGSLSVPEEGSIVAEGSLVKG